MTTRNDRYVSAWLDTYRAAGASPGTVAVRSSHIERLARHGNLLSNTTRDLQAFLMQYRHLAPESRKSMTESVRLFYRWAVLEGLIDVSPADGLRRVRAPRGVPRPIPQHALRAALALADDETTLMILLGAYAGLRRAEIARVHSDDVDGLAITVTGKGGVRRRVPIHPMLAGRLARINGWAFPSPRRPGEHVTPDYVSDRLGRVMPAPYTPHSLRHYFATAAYRGTHNLRAVQQLLGHASPTTTALYTLVDEDDMTAAVESVA